MHNMNFLPKNINYKKIAKHGLFILTVPAIIVVGYYGVKAFKRYKAKKEQKKNETKAIIDNDKWNN